METAAIRIIPWLSVPDWEHPGPGKHRLNAQVWVMVNPSPRNRVAIASLPGAHRDVVHATAAHRALIHSSPAAPWTIEDCKTLDKVLEFIIKREVLPNNLLPSNLHEPKTWTDGSVKLYALLDIQNPAHQYIIWISIITARSCPRLTILEPKSSDADKAAWEKALKKYSDGPRLSAWLMKLPFKISNRSEPLKGRTDMDGVTQAILMYYLSRTTSAEELKTAAIEVDWDNTQWKTKLCTHILLLFEVLYQTANLGCCSVEGN
jgi:hypothetical protein